MDTLPIGAIIAWHKNLTGTPALPAGWVECNGGTLYNPDSPYHGQAIPDLNGDKRFLRGGSVSGDLQQDAFQGHRHSLGSYTFTVGTASNCTLARNVDGTYGKDPVTDGTHGTPRVDSETRPINMSVVWIMKVSNTRRESRLIPPADDDIHVNVNVNSDPPSAGGAGKIGVSKTPVSEGGGAGTMVEGTVYAGAIPLTRVVVGKVLGGTTKDVAESDELKVLLSYTFLSKMVGAPFVYANATFKRWDETNHVWTTLDVEQFAVASTLQAGAKEDSHLSAEIHIKNAEPGEAFLIGVTMA